MHIFFIVFRVHLFQIAKNNRLKVYRQTIKHETTSQCKASLDSDKLLKSSDVGCKKLILEPSVSTSKKAAVATEAKLLLLRPVEVDGKKSNEAVADDDHNNNSDIRMSCRVVDGADIDSYKGQSSINEVNTKGCISETISLSIGSEHTYSAASEAVAEAASQVITAASKQKGQKMRKKPVAAGKKGI